MPGKRQPTKKSQAKPATVSAVTPKPAEITQAAQMRKDLLNEIKDLKKQVLFVQLQSMKVMQQSVHSLFKTQTDKTAEQVAQQNTNLQKQFEEKTDTVNAAETENSKKTDDGIETNDNQIEKFNDIVLNAMQSAQKSVDSAMEAAQKIMGDAENILRNS